LESGALPIELLTYTGPSSVDARRVISPRDAAYARGSADSISAFQGGPGHFCGS